MDRHRKGRLEPTRVPQQQWRSYDTSTNGSGHLLTPRRRGLRCLRDTRHCADGCRCALAPWRSWIPRISVRLVWGQAGSLTDSLNLAITSRVGRKGRCCCEVSPFRRSVPTLYEHMRGQGIQSISRRFSLRGRLSQAYRLLLRLDLPQTKDTV